MLNPAIMNRCIGKAGLCMLILVVCFLVGSGCSLKSPFIGKKMVHRYLTDYVPGEKISTASPGIVFEFTINKTDEEEEYVVEGTMELAGDFKSGAAIVFPHKSWASLLLAKDDIVTDSIPLSIMGINPEQKLPFKKKFKTGHFDSSMVVWQIWAAG